MPEKYINEKITSLIQTAADSGGNNHILKVKQSFLDLHHYQYQHNLPYQKYCDFAEAEKVIEISDIPALPTDAFKANLNPTSLKQKEIATTFLTSGTTTDIKGLHHFSSTATYDASIIAGWKYCQLPQLHQTLILTPRACEAPHSSLSHMMETIKRELAPNAQFILQDGNIDPQMIIDAAKNNTPLTLLGTALAFLKLFDILETLPAIQLPAGSWALETGGYKGSNRSLTKEQLYQKFQIHLGIPTDQIWNEYSMTELSSQFYTKGLGNPHIAPPWTHIKVIHPETNLPVKPSEIGYLVIYDLANIDSVIAIRTQDLAIFHDSQSFTLIGRDPSALPRGCSRSL
jgi:hypothetical protein